MAQGTTKGVPIDIDGTLSQNSDLLVASQKATKTYVDNGLLLKQDIIGYTPVNKGGDTMLGNLILNANPTLPLQAATKDYIDTLINGIDWKQAAIAGTVASLPAYTVTGSGQVLTGNSNGAIPSATTDGVTLALGNRVLVKSETSTLTPNNGIYVVTQVGDGSNPFILTRSQDSNTSSELSEATLSISSGSTLSNTQWHCNPASTPITIGTTYLTFAQIGSGTYTAGSGLTLISNVFSIATNGVTDAMIQSATNWNTAYSSRITTANAPLSISSNTISITQATNSVDGYLSSTDWTTFNNKQNTITLTTTGSSGSSTFGANILNIPTYTLSGLGGVPTSRTLTINGTAYDLSLDRSWSVGTVTSVAALTIGTSGTDITSSVANSSTTPVITLNIPTASATNRGALSSTDWNTFNGKQDTITLTTTGTSGAATFTSNTLNIPQYQSVLTNPVTGTGTTNEIAYWTSSSAIGSLTTATYPSLTELSYVKGVTSAIQTQLNGKQGTLTLTTTGTSGAATLVGNTLNIPQYSGGGSMAIGGTVTSGTAGSILFINPTATLAQDNANLFWDNTNNRLGIGTATPAYAITANKNSNTGEYIYINNSNAGTAAIAGMFINASAGAFTLQAISSGFTPDTVNNIYPNSARLRSSAGLTNGLYFTTGTTAPMYWGTNDVLRMIVFGSTGNVLIQNGGTFTDAGYRLDVNGLSRFQDTLLVRKNQNALTDLGASNTTAGTTARATLSLTSDSGFFRISKLSNSYTSGSPTLFSAGDTLLANSSGGNLVIYNQVATGIIRLTAGGQNAAHVTIGTTGITTFTNQITSTLANSTTTGGGQLYLNGATGNRIDFNQNGVAAPAFTTRSAGTKLVLFPGISATTTDFALGIEGGALWSSVGEATSIYSFKWYAGVTNILTLTGAGVMTLSRNQNAQTALTVSNTTSGTSGYSSLILTSDATSGSLTLSKLSGAYTTYKIFVAKDVTIYNSGGGGDIAFLNDFASGTIKFAAGGSSTAQLTIAANGNITQSVNQNATTTLTIGNTTSGTSAGTAIVLGSDSSSSCSLGKFSATTTAIKIIAAKDAYFYNDSTSGGDIAILNNFACGTIKMAAGGSSVSQLVLKTTGQLQLDNYTSTSAFTGTAAGYLAFDSSGNILSAAAPGGSSTVTFNRQTASYTLVLADAGKMVEMNVATANNLTIPLNSSVAFAIGTQIDVTQYGAGQTTFVATSGVTIRSTNGWLKMNARYGAATLIKVNTDEWYLFGNINA